MRAIRTHGGLQRHNHPYVNQMHGYLAGSCDLGQIAFDWEVEQRGAIGSVYRIAQDHCGAPETMPEYHVYAIHHSMFQSRGGRQFIRKLVFRRQFITPRHARAPVFSHLGYQWGDFQFQKGIAVISLPMHPFCTSRQIALAEVKNIAER